MWQPVKAFLICTLWPMNKVMTDLEPCLIQSLCTCMSSPLLLGPSTFCDSICFYCCYFCTSKAPVVSIFSLLFIFFSFCCHRQFYHKNDLVALSFPPSLSHTHTQTNKQKTCTNTHTHTHTHPACKNCQNFSQVPVYFTLLIIINIH